MKTQLNRLAGRRAFGSGLPITATLLLLAVLPATAQSNTPFTATGWVIGAPVLGSLCTNQSGQVFLKGNVHVGRVQADDPRMTGHLQAMMDVAYQADGTLPATEATFDNFELRTYELPPLGIQRAVQLTWPAPDGLNWTVEGAPTVHGPWLPVQDSMLPGLQQMTVPANDIMKFFRLQQAP